MTTVGVQQEPRVSELIKLALPIIAGLGSQTLLSLVDTAMIGRLGAAPLAAVGLAGMAIWVLTTPFQGLGPAVQAITARRFGESQQRPPRAALRNGFNLVLLVGLPYIFLLSLAVNDMMGLLSSDSAVITTGGGYLLIRLPSILFAGLNLCLRGYFIGIRKPGVHTRILLMMHPLNIALNYVLIFGKFGAPELGAAGAALGATIATAVGTLLGVVVLLRQSGGQASPVPKPIQGAEMRKLINLAAPACLQNLSLALGYLLFFRIAAMIGTQAAALVNILININLGFIMISRGLGLATITLVGNALGHDNPTSAWTWIRKARTTAAIVLGCAGLLVAAAPSFWLHVFMPDPVLINAAITPLTLLGLSQAFEGAGMVLSYAHLGGGATKRVMLISVVNQWLIFLPAAFIAVHVFNGGLTALWTCMFCYRLLWFASFAASAHGGGWMKRDL